MVANPFTSIICAGFGETHTIPPDQEPVDVKGVGPMCADCFREYLIDQAEYERECWLDRCSLIGMGR